MSEHFQRRVLALYLTFRDRDPTVLQLVRFNLGRYLLFFAIIAPIIWVEWIMVGWTIAALFISFLLGALVRDIGRFGQTKTAWPLTRELTDWTKVDALAAKLNARREKTGKP